MAAAEGQEEPLVHYARVLHPASYADSAPAAAPRSSSAGGAAARTAVAAQQRLLDARDALLWRLPPGAERALRKRGEQAAPFAPHALCALAGLLIGRLLGRRAERRKLRGLRRGGSAAAAAPALEARLRSADSDAKRADKELSALHDEMKALEKGLARSKPGAAAAYTSDGDAAGAALRAKVAEAANAYDTVTRVLAAERQSSALRLARAAAENALLTEQLAQARAPLC
jgi:hypothetical protein